VIDQWPLRFPVTIRRGSVGIASWHCGKPTNGFEHFTVEEAKAAVAVLEFAIKIAEVEREEMEKRNGH